MKTQRSEQQRTERRSLLEVRGLSASDTWTDASPQQIHFIHFLV